MKHAYNYPLASAFPLETAAYIEVSARSRCKYEYNNKTGYLELDRILHSPLFYPHNYGFIPRTLCGDGDPLDVLVVCDDVLMPGCIVFVRPVGYMKMSDEKGADEKLVCVVVNDPRYIDVQSLNQLPSHLLREIEHFFSVYKALEPNKWTRMGTWFEVDGALELLKTTHQAYVDAAQESGTSKKPGAPL